MGDDDDRYGKDPYEENPVSHEEQKQARYGKETTTESDDLGDTDDDGLDHEDQKRSRYGKESEEDKLGR